MKVTKSNLHYVARLLRKYLMNGFNTQTFYPEAKKFNSVLRHFNIENNRIEFLYKIERSNVCNFQQGIVEIEDYYIRIHNNNFSTDYWDEDLDNYRAMLVYVGDEIKFNKGLITIRQEFVTHDAKCIEKITFNN